MTSVKVRTHEGGWRIVPCHSRVSGGFVIAEPQAGAFSVSSVVNGYRIGPYLDSVAQAKRCRRELVKRFPQLSRFIQEHGPNAPQWKITRAQPWRRDLKTWLDTWL